MITAIKNFMGIIPFLILTPGASFFADAAEQSTLSEGQSFIKRKIVLGENRRLTGAIIGCLAEKAMHNADRYLELGMVPPYEVKTIEEEGKQALVCECPWIEPIDEKIHHSDKLKSIISKKDWAHMNIWDALVQNHDRHFGNRVISRKTGRCHLIDNEAVANVNKFVMGYSSDKKISCAWVPIMLNDSLLADKEPEEFTEVIKAEQQPDVMLSSFPQVDEWTQEDIKHGYCRVWKKMLWRQMYARDANITAAFSECITPELHKKIQSLTKETLISFWPPLPFQASDTDKNKYKEIVEKFAENTLIQKKRILDYFEEHPEGIQHLD